MAVVRSLGNGARSYFLTILTCLLGSDDCPSTSVFGMVDVLVETCPILGSFGLNGFLS